MSVEFDWMAAVKESPIMLSLLAGSVVTLGVALERLWYFRRLAGDADGLLEGAQADLRAHRVDAALARCRTSRSPLGVVASETLDCHLTNPAATEETMQVALSRQKLLLEHNTGLLGTMAAVAPLVGLLGTVWGIMRAFHDMALTGSAAPTVVAAGVSEALLTTAAGLIIAVPAVLLYNHFNRRITVTLIIAENHTRSLRTALDQVSRATISSRAAAPMVESPRVPSSQARAVGRRETIDSVNG